MKSIILVAYGTIYEMAHIFYEYLSWKENNIGAYT